jgi:purine-binding chemotaxis protein CheW
VKALIVGIEARVCALPLANVIEIMRPLPIEAISGVPRFVLGVSVIRGIATPVVDLEAILGAAKQRAAGRFVTVRAGDKQVALMVDAVLGIRWLDELKTARQLPPLLQGAAGDVVETIGALDEKLLLVLQSAWKLPSEVWEAMATQEVVS